MQVPGAIEAFVDRVSVDGDAAAEWVHADAEFELPGNQSLPAGSAGAQAFASRHGAADGRLISVEFQGPRQWRLRFVNCEIATGDHHVAGRDCRSATMRSSRMTPTLAPAPDDLRARCQVGARTTPIAGRSGRELPRRSDSSWSSLAGVSCTGVESAATRRKQQRE
jgi:hypothetical protein